MSSFKTNTTASKLSQIGVRRRKWTRHRLSAIGYWLFAPLCLYILVGSAWAQELTPLVVQGFNTAGPGQSATLANAYTIGAPDISNLPQGDTTNITDVLAQMPGVAIDQNQQIHIRNTEGPQFQYQINGVMARRFAMKMGRRLRCSSVTYRFRYAPSYCQSGSDRLAGGPF